MWGYARKVKKEDDSKLVRYLCSRITCIAFEFWMQNLDTEQRVKSLTDYSLWRYAHNVTAFGEEQMQIFHWTVATSFCLRVIRKTKKKSLSEIIFLTDKVWSYLCMLFFTLNTLFIYIYILVFFYNANITNLYSDCSYTLLHLGIRSLPWPELFWAGETLSTNKTECMFKCAAVVLQ